MSKYALVMADGRKSKYGLNACLGALESLEDSAYPDIRWIQRDSSLEDCLSELIEESTLPLVLWSLYSPEYVEAAKRLESLRAAFSHVERPPIHIIGGVHASAEPELCARAGWDFVAQGEGERTMANIVRAMNAGEALASVSGLGYLDGDHYVASRGASLETLDESPSFALRQGRVGPIEITRGCIYACSFCQTPFMFKARFRHRSVESVCWHVDAQVARGMTDVRFISPTSLSYGTQDENPDLDQVDKLLLGVRNRLPAGGRIFFGSFPSEIRPEHASVEALRLIQKRANNDNVILGAQSGSDRILALSHRGHNSDSVRRAVENCRTVGLRANVDFIFGMPGEGDEDVAKTIALCKELVKMGARIHTHTFMPLPGTPWSHERAGSISPELRQTIEKLTASGQAYGNWEQQIAIAEELAAFESFANRRKRVRNRPRGT